MELFVPDAWAVATGFLLTLGSYAWWKKKRRERLTGDMVPRENLGPAKPAGPTQFSEPVLVLGPAEPQDPVPVPGPNGQREETSSQSSPVIVISKESALNQFICEKNEQYRLVERKRE